jgi:hypothetical protein
MPSKRLFNRRYGKGASARLRSMLDDPQFAYQHIGDKFGLTRQYISKLAKGLAIKGRQRQRQRERMLHRKPHIVKVDYPPGVRSVINKIKRSGIPVTPYVFPPSQANVAWRSQKMVVVNGVLCTIQLRKGSKKGPNRGEYARFDVNREVKRAKVALWAMRSGRRIRVYVIPLTICEKSLLFIFQLTVNMPWTPARNPGRTGRAMSERGTCSRETRLDFNPSGTR